MNLYHKILRVHIAVFALVLLFDSGILFPITSELSKNAQNHLANTVGVTAGVDETEINLITAQLREYEQELTAREKELSNREIRVGIRDGIGQGYSTYILSVILFILLVLITLNYVLDWVRMRRQRIYV